MQYRLGYRLYSRCFRQPLRTSHGVWSDRQGIILRLTDANERIGFGEIAPIEWFGSENLEQALAFCQQLLGQITADTIRSIPDSLPACQFGFEAAWKSIADVDFYSINYLTNYSTKRNLSHLSLTYSSLLPTGKAALHNWETLWREGVRTFKWKVGVADLSEELALFEQLIQVLPPEARLRLDANAGLNWEQACLWLDVADQAGVEFFEQPLPVSQFDDMLRLSNRYQTAIALDESVATLEQMRSCYQRGWRGVFVVKAAIAGFPSRLLEFCQTHPLDVVWSSVFETAIAHRFIETQLIQSLPPSSRALGGVNGWFTDNLEQAEFEHIWQSF